MTTKSQPVTMGDIVIHMESQEYCCDPAIIRNPGGSAIDLDRSEYMGMPVVAGSNGADYNLAASTGEANVVGLIVDGPENIVLEATSNTVKRYKVLRRAPCIVNLDKIQANDYAGVAFDTVAEIITALRALGWVLKAGPAKQTTHST